MLNKKLLFFVPLLVFNLFNISACYADECDELPKFITYPYIEKNHIKAVSYYRSLVGPAYTEHNQQENFKCQSNKHYFLVNNKLTEIFAPCDGIIHEINENSPPGFKIIIIPHDNSKYMIVLSHINFTQSINEGEKIKAGDYLGTHSNANILSDIAVWDINTNKTTSAFCHMTDKVLEYYGIDDGDSMIIPQDLRDKFPSNCKDTKYNLPQTSKYNGPKNWFILHNDIHKNTILNFLNRLFSTN